MFIERISSCGDYMSKIMLNWMKWMMRSEKHPHRPSGDLKFQDTKKGKLPHLSTPSQENTFIIVPS